jgi:hypothetical protein
MDVHVSPENQASLDQIAMATGRSHDAIVNDVLAGYLGELLETRRTLNSRYDDLVSGRVQGIDGETARHHSLARIEARRIAAQSK